MPQRILFVAAECVPLVKTGGLADVAGALPAALRELGLDVRVLLPGYPQVIAALPGAKPAARVDALGELPPAVLVHAEIDNGVPVYAIDCPPLYDRPGGPYQDPSGKDWPDNALRFAQLGRAAAWLAARGADSGWRADALHLNDWHAALGAAYVRFSERPRAPVLFTVHNLAFQGLFDAQWRARLALPASSWSIDGVEFHGKLSFMKAGLQYADAITTVSPTYAREIQSAPLGMGLEGLLAARRDVLHGILNGIDTVRWDPRRDPLIAANYDADSLDAKAANKRALQHGFGLAVDAAIPLAAMASRLTEQKGADLVADCAEALIGSPAQLVVVGTGERSIELRFEALAARNAGRIGVHIGFDEALAHLIEAGADMFLMPSRFEPCGLNQMYSQRYGTVPIVGATGGLVDSVVDCTEAALADGTATGFHIRPIDADGLCAAFARALAVYRDAGRWRQLQRNGMAKDFGWGRSAVEYARLYEQIAQRESAGA
ncbi:MAG: glycogen synthase GlgA [Burkholderiaceae bacterium]|nr:glycogen synthase GlgA [Burkholderiaceae bacterium]